MKLRSLGIGLALAVCHAGVASCVQEREQLVVEVAEVAAPRAQLGAARVEVPMDLRTRLPVLEVKVNGRGPYLFVLDTGAAGTAIDDDLAKDLSLPVIGKALVDDASGEPPVEQDLVNIESLTIGESVFRDNPANVGDVGGVLAGDLPISGILGFNTFADCLLTLDYPGEKLIMSSGQLPPADGRDVISYTAPAGIPVLRLTIGSQPADVTIDSGAGTGVVLAEALEDRLALKAPPEVIGRARAFNTETEIRAAQLDGDILLGRHVIHDPIVAFSGTMSVIGWDILKDFALTFDQKSKTVRLHHR